ncbi:MAG: prenyltransferase [Pyrinomonadaceae bacterium]
MTKIVKISRPRFWLYLFGTYLVGLAAGATSTSDLYRLDSILFGLYFLFPANLLVYGVNDIFDFETDLLNPKKTGYEVLVRPEMYRSLWTWIAVLNIPFIIAAIVMAPRTLLSLVPFLFLAVFYSALPIRAKEVPVVDSLFNILYVFPAAFGYQMLSGDFPPLGALIGAGAWTAAMHAYSAIPDIASDRAAGIETVATLLGRGWTHGFCIACFTVATFIGIAYGSPAALLGLIYVGLMRFSDASSDAGIVRIYKVFPFLNALTGFVLFWSIAWPKFH